MGDTRRLRYVSGDQVKAGPIVLNRVPIAVDGYDDEPIGELNGIVIDIDACRVHSLVIEGIEPDLRHMVPLDAISLDAERRLLRLSSAQAVERWEVFEPSDVEGYDDEAVLALMFGR